MNTPINHMPSSSVTLSMMISEGVYRLIAVVEQVWQKVTTR